jgi:DNA-binding response OmpR family regulator
MTIPTVFMVGVERLPLVPEYLNLGSVVVVAPDQDTLRRWVWEQDERSEPATDGEGESQGTVVDLAGRRIVSDGTTLPLSDLEYRVLSALLSPPGRAISFRDLRSTGWGDSQEIPADIYSVRALVQRLRAKLQVARADVTIEAIRGFGFRATDSTVRGRFRTREERAGA